MRKTIRGCLSGPDRCEIGYEKTGESPFHLIIGKSKPICGEPFVIALDGQISALIEQWQGIDVDTVDTAQQIGSHLFLKKLFQIVVSVLQGFCQHGWGACLKPVVLECLTVEGAQQTEGVVDAYRVGIEMISVIGMLQFLITLLLGKLALLSKFSNLFVQIMADFFFCDAANVSITLVHGDVRQIVEVAENTYL